MEALFNTFRAVIDEALEADDTLTLADVNTALDLTKADLINVMLTAGDDDDDSEDDAE
jgi:hypothetical protein